MQTIRLTTRICMIVALAGFCTASAWAGAVYSDLSGTPSYGLGSLGYEAYGASEFGGVVQVDTTNGSYINNATVQMVNFAYESQYSTYVAADPLTTPGQPNSDGYGADASLGYYVPLTFTLYSVTADGSINQTLGSGTTDALIGWASGADSPSTQDVNIALPNIQVTDGQYIAYGLSFDTDDYGTDPLGAPGGVESPEDSLNFGLTLDAATTGLNPALFTNDPNTCANGSANPSDLTTPANYCDTAYWDTAIAGNTEGTAGVFSQDTYWISSGYGSGVIELDATPTVTPEPATFGLIGFGLLALAGARKKKRG